MKYFILILIASTSLAWGQLVNSLEVSGKFKTSDEATAKKELLHTAVLKSFEKMVPKLGFKYLEFHEKLESHFEDYFNRYKEKKAIEKFGENNKKNLSESERTAFLASLEAERNIIYKRFTRTTTLIHSHTFEIIKKDENSPFLWTAKVNLEFDKIKLERFLNKIIKDEKKPFAKIVVITEVDLQGLTWTDLGLDNEKVFTSPLNNSWLKWLNDNIPTSVEEVVLCDAECLIYFRKWSESQLDQISVPDEYQDALFLETHLQLKKVGMTENLQEVKFEWEGRTLIHDLATKRILESFTLPQEKRTFRQLDQKAINSGLVSALYRSPLTAFMQFKKKLEEKIGFNRVSKLVFKGYRHIGDVMALNDLIKARGNLLGLEIVIESFSKEEANLLCFYRGEEKSFTDILSGIKEVKSPHGYTLVNEFTGVHYVIKFVTE